MQPSNPHLFGLKLAFIKKLKKNLKIGKFEKYDSLSKLRCNIEKPVNPNSLL